MGKSTKQDKKMVKDTQKRDSSIKGKPEGERKRKLDDSSTEEASSKPSSEKNSAGKKGKAEPKPNLDSNLGVVDTNILQQAGVNLGLPLADDEASIPETTIAKKKKKNKKSEQPNSQAPVEKNKTDRTIDYLRLWQSSRKQWKFNKMLQVHLFSIMYNESLLTDEDFDTLLLYLEDLKGKSREQTKNEAEKIINSDNKADDSSDSSKEERARQIIQILS